jgi:hypothetical protein
MSKLQRLIDVLAAYPGYNFDYGLDAELALNGDQAYPLMYLEEPILGTVDIDKNLLHTLEFALLMLDKDTGNNDGVNYKDNTPKIDGCINALPGILKHLDDNRLIVQSLSYVTLRDFGSDATSGIRVELSVIDYTKC